MYCIEHTTHKHKVFFLSENVINQILQYILFIPVFLKILRTNNVCLDRVLRYNYWFKRFQIWERWLYLKSLGYKYQVQNQLNIITYYLSLFDFWKIQLIVNSNNFKSKAMSFQKATFYSFHYHMYLPVVNRQSRFSRGVLSRQVGFSASPIPLISRTWIIWL